MNVDTTSSADTTAKTAGGTSPATPTELIHHPYRPPAGFEAPQIALHKASTVLFANVAAMRERDWRHKSGYTYGLHGTPTTFTLEERLSALEGGAQCLLAPSGLAAIALTAFALLKPGDAVLLPDNVYGPNRELGFGELARFGVQPVLYDPLELADLQAKLTPGVRMVWLEAPGSVTMEFPDLVAQVRLCKERGALAVLDNTWGAGIAFAPFDLLRDGSLGVDVSVHALTKYPSGGADVLMGSVVTRNPDLHQQLKLTHMRLGLGVGANDAEAVLRGLPSMALRYRAHDEAARRLATWLEQQPQVAQVLHPALPGSPGHAHWRALCGRHGEGQGAAAGLFSIVMDDRFGQREVDAFCDALRCFRVGYSWGGPMSLVVPYTVAAMRSRPTPHLRPGCLVRFSVGLERPEDLQADLAQALAAALPV